MTVDRIVSELHAKPSGRDRWRAPCPVCGGSNHSTLSVGIGDSGAVLLKCFKSGCDAQAIAQAIGLSIEDLFPPRDSAGAPLKRRRMLSDRQALELRERETMLVWTCAQNLANGYQLTPADLERLNVAAREILSTTKEARQ